MATVEMHSAGGGLVPFIPPSEAHRDARRLHRIRTVRLREGVSLRSAARQMGTDVRSLRLQEEESTDLRLSDLRRWQKALDVPLTELVEETEEPLSRPVLDRARLVRVMKTAAAIHEHSPSLGVKRMATMLVEQLVEIMPELKNVSPWHTYGQRRSLDEFGRIVERRFSEAMLDSSDED